MVASAGDIDRPFYLRSSAKPFQAHVSQESGADLSQLELAMACASHRGQPVHIGLVRSMLESAGLHESQLRCPESWPIHDGAMRRLSRSGERSPRRVWHNCSGKHAGFLRACLGSGWSLESYHSPDHPLQRRVVDFVSELGDHDVGPVGVDGCGVPVLRTTARAMSLLFARLGSERLLRDVFMAMHRYPALIGCNGEGDTTIAIATHAAAKGGARGCIGVSVESRLGIAVKAWDGDGEIAAVGAIAALDQVGLLTTTARHALADVGAPAVTGGHSRVGLTEPRLELQHT